MRLAVIAGDGIGPEVVAEGLKVLRSVAPDLETTPYDLGATRWQRTGELLPDSVLDELRGDDGSPRAAARPRRGAAPGRRAAGACPAPACAPGCAGTTRSSSARSATRACRRASSSAACSCGCA